MISKGSNGDAQDLTDDGATASPAALDKLKSMKNIQKYVNGDTHPDDDSLYIHVYVLILELNWLDMDKKTFNAWVEIGMIYDVYDYLRNFDYNNNEKDDNIGDVPDMSRNRNGRLKRIYPNDMDIPFDIVNAITMEERSSTHFIKKSSRRPQKFYSRSEGQSQDGSVDEEQIQKKPEEFLSDEERLVSFVDVGNCPRRQYWKHQTRSFNMELSFKSKENMAPFDELYLFFKLITANCQPGTCKIKWIYNKDESWYQGMQQHIGGFDPVLDEEGHVTPIINQKTKMNIAGQTWDRLYISVRLRRRPAQEILQFYVIPMSMFMFIAIKPFDHFESLIGVSSTLVIANVALLIVTQRKVFSYSEMSIIIQVIMVVIGTIVLAFEDVRDRVNATEIALICTNVIVTLLTLGTQYFYSWSTNKAIATAVENHKFDIIDTL